MISVTALAGCIFLTQEISLPQDYLASISLPRRSALEFGVASWYSESDPYINTHTASGEIFNEERHTCASWHYPFGTLLRVTNLSNERSVVCRVNDRGPAKRLGRIIDLTKAAFSKIAPLGRGLVRVSVTPVRTQQNPQAK